ncbi:MAG: DNA alkylation repair protein [Acidobacteria bacterium]|nr:DNA alkylation repair protein [Acidobacteriota bacterium]
MQAAPVLADVLARLAAAATPKDLANLQRFGIAASRPLGVSMANIQKVAGGLGCNHALAAELWGSGIHEAKLLAAYVDEPAKVTAAQMDRWVRDFDNWAVCDTRCFALLDRTPHAWRCVDRWASARQEFVRRAAFALMASLAVHDKAAPDACFLDRLPLIEAAADDARDLVRKGVSWALRTAGRRRPALHRAALAVATRLAAPDDAGARWVGKDASRDLRGPVATRAVLKRAAKKR